MFFAIGMLAGSLSLLACADQPPGRSLTPEAMEKVEVQLKLLRAESDRFDANHPLKGRVADTALRQLSDEGYACHIDYLDLMRTAKDGVTFEFVRTPLVFCTQRSSQPDDFCAERHVNLRIGWKDQTAPEPELRSQLTSSVITARAFRCAPASEVKR